jgi:ribosomal protein S3
MILSGVDKKNNLNDRITSIHVGPTHESGSCNRTSKNTNVIQHSTRTILVIGHKNKNVQGLIKKK